MARISKRPGAGPARPTETEGAAKAALLAEIDAIGWFLRGSLLQAPNRCGKASCRCHGDPPQPHGPYWIWTRKVAGKTVTVRVSDAQVELVRTWLANAKRFDRKMDELGALCVQVTERILAAVAEN